MLVIVFAKKKDLNFTDKFAEEASATIILVQIPNSGHFIPEPPVFKRSHTVGLPSHLLYFFYFLFAFFLIDFAAI